MRKPATVALLLAASCALDPNKIKPVLPADALTFCNELVNSLVALQAACQGASPFWVSQEPGLPDCFNMDQAVRVGHTAFDAIEAYDCVTAVDFADCDDLTRLFFKTFPAACTRAVRGTVQAGGSCADDVECAAGTYCAGCVPGGSLGSCQPRRILDQTCTADAECAPGLACLDTSAVASVRLCRPVSVVFGGAGCGLLGANTPSATGAICSSGYYCKLGSCTLQHTTGACLIHEECNAGYRCAAQAAGGRACQLGKLKDDACTPGRQECEVGTYCGAGNTCVLGPTSGTCGLVNGELVNCTGTTCSVTVDSGTSTSGTCNPAPVVCSVP